MIINLITTQRSGSNFLRACLNSHPDITAYDEVFVNKSYPPRHPEKDNEQFFSEQYDKMPSKADSKEIKEFLDGLKKNEVTIIDIKYNQVTKEIWDEIKYNRCIHLKRRNLLKWAIARVLSTRPTPFKIKPEKLESLINSTIKNRRKFDKMIDTPCLELSYENLTYGISVSKINKLIAERICNFLGLNYNALEIDGKKRHPSSLDDLLKNTKEVKEYFA